MDLSSRDHRNQHGSPPGSRQRLLKKEVPFGRKDEDCPLRAFAWHLGLARGMDELLGLIRLKVD
jgi:hypothetical protein